jgi:hypothetical protein
MKLAAAFAGVVLIATVQSASIGQVEDVVFGLEHQNSLDAPQDATRKQRVIIFTIIRQLE